MTSSSYVLIVSTVADIATDDVIKRLTEKSVPHRRLNTEDFPFNNLFAFKPEMLNQGAWLEVNGEVLPPPTSIWYRRFRSPPIPDGMDSGIHHFCVQESRAALLGAIVGSSARWMSHPSAIWQSEYKPLQLSMASKIGLKIPKTIITNDPSAIRKAFIDFGEIIVKPVRTGYVSYEGEDHSIFTSQILQEHLDELENATLSPSIYQELIPKSFDIRVTIVGKRLFSAAIDSQSDPDASVDWRHTANPLLPHYSITLPQEIHIKLLKLMELLGLNFAAIDLVQTPDGEYVFLEVNPNGQWLWIDDILNLGISDAVADWLSVAETACQN